MAINYSKVNWDTNKYVNPTNMNQMDNGIKSACDMVDHMPANNVFFDDGTTVENASVKKAKGNFSFIVNWLPQTYGSCRCVIWVPHTVGTVSIISCGAFSGDYFNDLTSNTVIDAAENKYHIVLRTTANVGNLMGSVELSFS